MLFRQHYTGFFLCNITWSLLGNITQDFYLCHVVSRVLRQHRTKYLPFNVVWRLLENIAQSIYLFNVVPRELRKHWTKFFLVQCCVESQRQHCLGCSVLVQCCHKSVKTTLNRIFSCAMLSGTSWATLHKVLTWAMLADG